jgi:hypothetical protein
MKTIQSYIAEKQTQFALHPFFTHLEKCASIHDFLEVSADLAFWVMVFQDILRLNEERVKDPYLHKLAKHHRIEDRGHELWFLEDIENLRNKNKRDITGLFDKNNTSTRDAAYAILAEVFNLHDERLRVILLFTLESTGHIFFGKAADFVEKTGYTQRLKYFSNNHLEVEKAHAMFEESMEKEFFSIVLSVEKRAEALALVDSVYNAFSSMFDGLMKQINANKEQIKTVNISTANS